MSDTLNIPVKSTTGQPFAFVPHDMTIRVLGNDFATGNDTVHFELRTDGQWDTALYQRRDWISQGEVAIPANLLASATANGQLNVASANQLLAPFDLCIDEERLPQQNAG